MEVDATEKGTRSTPGPKPLKGREHYCQQKDCSVRQKRSELRSPEPTKGKAGAGA